MDQHSRRNFLRHSAAAAGALAISPAAFGEDNPADMCIARWDAEPDPDEGTGVIGPKLTEAAINNIGGMKRFVKSGMTVWVKPNIAWDRNPAQAGNTNPDVVKTLVRLCYEAGAAKVKVGDNPCHDADKSYKNSGIEAAAKAAGADVIYLDRDKCKTVRIGGKLEEIPFFPEIMEADLLISAPVVKHHSAATVTLTMKNFMGVIEDRRKLHKTDLDHTICEVAAYLKPRLAVMDAIRILTANGPVGGDLKDVKRCNIVAAGTDLVALDAFGSELLGYQPAEIKTVTIGHETGMGEMDYRKLKLADVRIS
jgi:uncharacterized protein (DUF362 family)